MNATTISIGLYFHFYFFCIPSFTPLTRLVFPPWNNCIYSSFHAHCYRNDPHFMSPTCSHSVLTLLISLYMQPVKLPFQQHKLIWTPFIVKAHKGTWNLCSGQDGTSDTHILPEGLGLNASSTSDSSSLVCTLGDRRWGPSYLVHIIDRGNLD